MVRIAGTECEPVGKRTNSRYESTNRYPFFPQQHTRRTTSARVSTGCWRSDGASGTAIASRCTRRATFRTRWSRRSSRNRRQEKGTRIKVERYVCQRKGQGSRERRGG